MTQLRRNAELFDCLTTKVNIKSLRIAKIELVKITTTPIYQHIRIIKSFSIVRRFVPNNFQKATNSLKQSPQKQIIYFDIALGGGTEQFSKNKIELLSLTNNIIRVQYIPNIREYLVTVYCSGQEFFFLIGMQSLVAFLKLCTICEIILNNLSGYRFVDAILKLVAELKVNNPQILLTAMGHDYFALCPRSHLMTDGFEFCGVQEPTQCAKYCSLASKFISQQEWRLLWGDFFGNYLDELIVFSESGRDIFCRAYPFLKGKIVIAPHAIPVLRKVYVTAHPTINIALLGYFAEHKGSKIVNQMAENLPKDVHIFLVGDALVPINDNITVLGKYERSSLPNILEKIQVDIVFISSVCPETFSYTTSEAIAMGLPVACFAVGAPQERVRIYERGLVISQLDPQIALSEIVSFARTIRSC